MPWLASCCMIAARGSRAVESHAVRLIRVRMARGHERRRYAVVTGKQLIVAEGETTAGREYFVEPAHLHTADGSLDIGHPVIEAELSILFDFDRARLMSSQVGRRGAMRADGLQAPGRVFIVREDRTALAGCDAFARVEAEAGEIGKPADARFANGRA